MYAYLDLGSALYINIAGWLKHSPHYIPWNTSMKESYTNKTHWKHRLYQRFLLSIGINLVGDTTEK